MACTKPHLGLATTRELLEEIRSRGEVSYIVGGEFDLYHAKTMYVVAKNLLFGLPQILLNYRTVDDG